MEVGRSDHGTGLGRFIVDGLQSLTYERVCVRERVCVNLSTNFNTSQEYKRCQQVVCRKYVRAKFDKNWKRKCVPIF